MARRSFVLTETAKLLVAASLVFAGVCHAQTIPNLPAASSVNPSDLFAVSQSGTTRKLSITQLAAGIPITLAVKGSSTGTTTLASANASATNYTLTLPAITDTVVTATATQTLTNKSISLAQITGAGTAAAQNTGTSGATIPFLNGTNTWSGAQTFSANLTAPGLTSTSAINWGGSSSTGSAALNPIYWNQTFTGSSTATGSSTNLNSWTIQDTLAAVPTNAANGLFMNMFVNTGSAGNRNTARFGIEIDTPPTSGGLETPTNNYVALFPTAIVNVNLGGTGTDYAHSQGSIWAINPDSICNTGATFLYTCQIEELDMTALAGSSMARKLGVDIIQGSNSAVHGSQDDEAILIANGPGTADSGGWLRGIAFGDSQTQWPFAPTATIMGGFSNTGFHAQTAANGIDFRSISFSGYSFASNNFLVDGQGGLTAGTLNITGLSTSAKTFNATTTGNFFAQNGANITFAGDRLFVGGGTANNGVYPFTNADWLSALQVGWGLVPAYPGTTQLLSLVGNSSSSPGSNAILGGSQTKYNPSPSAYIAGVAGFAVCNNTTVANQVCEGFYGQADRTLSTDGQAISVELDVAAHVAGQTASPLAQGLTVGIQDACGGGETITLFPCDAAMQIVANGSTFNAGIIFDAGSLTSGSPAIELPTGNPINFYDSSGDQAVIQATYTTAAAGRINFTDNGILMAGHDGSPVAYFDPCTSCVNEFAFLGAPAGSQVGLAAQGSDTNIGMNINAKGTGVIAFGSVVTAPTAAAGDNTTQIATDAFVQTAVGNSGAWTTYTPTLTAGSGTFTSASAAGRYRMSGKTWNFNVVITITTNGTAATSVKASLPFTAVTSCSVSGTNTTGSTILSAFIGSGASLVSVFTAAGAYPGATGATLVLNGTCEST